MSDPKGHGPTKEGKARHIAQTEGVISKLKVQNVTRRRAQQKRMAQPFLIIIILEATLYNMYNYVIIHAFEYN